MKTLVIPDIHNRVDQAQKLLDTVEHDRAVFLGDYFDNFGDNVSDAGTTARFLKKHIHNPKHTFLYGNHDVWYAFPWDALWCPGNNHEKRRMVRSILDPDDWKKAQLAHEEQGWWFSHAGLSPRYFVHPVKGFSKEVVSARCKGAMENAERRNIDPILMAGMDRGGSVHTPYGSILWADWWVFEAIEGANQIVGHTPSDWVRFKTSKDSVNYCLDTHSKNYIVITDGLVHVFDKEHNMLNDTVKAQSVNDPEPGIEDYIIKPKQK